MKARAIALAVVVLGCAKTAPQHRDGPQIADGRETPKPLVAEKAEKSGPACPLAVPGAKLSFAPVSGGGSLLFAAPDDADVQALRRRVSLLADERNRSAYRLAMIDVPYRAEMVPIPGGARLDLVTGVGNDTLELQRSLENYGSSMLAGICYDVK